MNKKPALAVAIISAGLMFNCTAQAFDLYAETDSETSSAPTNQIPPPPKNKDRKNNKEKLQEARKERMEKRNKYRKEQIEKRQEARKERMEKRQEARKKRIEKASLKTSSTHHQ